MSLLFRGFTYYKMSNLDTRIANPDQLLTTDVDKFCESCTDLYSNIAKPLLDIFIYVYRLTSSLGGKVSHQFIFIRFLNNFFLAVIMKIFNISDSSYYAVISSSCWWLPDTFAKTYWCIDSQRAEA